MINEDLVEQAALAILQDQGIPYLGADVISPDGTGPERGSYGEVLLIGRLEEAVARLNPRIPEDARRDALRQITGAASQSLTEENRRIHKLLVNGVDVE
ncbi:MAG: type I restriction endonuclease, partial [Paracoccaceae bacterium]